MCDEVQLADDGDRRRARGGPCRAAPAAAPSDGAWPCFEHHERRDHLAAQLVGPADDAGLGDRRVLQERALDLDRADAMRRRS